MIKWYQVVLKKYADFNGRARRSEFWNFVLVNAVINIGLGLVGILMENDILGIIYAFAIFLPTIAVGVRRMHDINKSGWYLLVPVFNFVLWATDGTRGSNEYGPDPKDNRNF
jgi:uncharacterized membrane protein YhaH (DUF805 family)